MQIQSYWSIVWREFKKKRLGVCALIILTLFFLIGLYAPLLSSSKPLVVWWNKALYFPLFRYLFYPGFYTKPIDLFYNLLMFTLPVAVLGYLLLARKLKKPFILFMMGVHIALFIWILNGAVKNPESNIELNTAKLAAKTQTHSFREDPLLSEFITHTPWSFELQYLSEYGKLNQLLHFKHMQDQHQRLIPYINVFEQRTQRSLPTLWHVWQRNEQEKQNQLLQTIQVTQDRYQEMVDKLPELMELYRPFSHEFIMAKYELEHAQSTEEKLFAQTRLDKVIQEASVFRAPLADARHLIEKHQKATTYLNFLKDRREWFEAEGQNLKIILPSLLRNFHWEDDAGGAQTLNQYVPWWEMTRVNRKDLLASLLFGIRISLVVGATAVVLSLVIGIPLGMIAGYFAGRTDLFISRLIEIWEAMPTFFMLLLVVAITQSKSIFLVSAILGVFGWTGIARFMRAEVLKQRHHPYVLSCHTLGYTHKRVMFSHIFPNAVAPILTLLPFSMMAAITAEAGLSFLGLGEEGSTSWGVLMDEGRSVFPSESYLLWPPAILLTILLISIALVGDSMRDAIDPKMRE